MRAYEKTDFLESLEAGTLLMKSSDVEGYVEYTSEDGRTMRYLPYLPPNCYLMPIEEALGNRYALSEFAKMSADFDKLAGCDSLDEFMKLWTFAYYTGQSGFSSRDVYVATDGVSYNTLPLFNYMGAFCRECDYESMRPPQRAFQVNWFYFKRMRGTLHGQPPYIRQAVEHFTQIKYYR